MFMVCTVWKSERRVSHKKVIARKLAVKTGMFPNKQMESLVKEKTVVEKKIWKEKG